MVKRSCAFCLAENRDELEQALLDGEISCKELDKDMTWRANTADRHFKNHMGEYHMDSNPSCVICSHDRRGEFETGYFEGILPSEDIAEVIGCSENSVYHHMKHHFQPLVKKSAAFGPLWLIVMSSGPLLEKAKPAFAAGHQFLFHTPLGRPLHLALIAKFRGRISNKQKCIGQRL